MRDLVLLHSLLTDRGAFDRVKDALAADFRLHIPDLPGYGGSASRGEASIEAYADRIAPEIPQGAALLGNGFGGFVAVMVAIRHGARLGALIAAPALAAFPAAAREPFRVMAAKVREGGMAAVLDAAVNRMFPPAFIAAHPGIVAERKRALAQADPQAFARACLALAELDMTPQLAAIGCRTLVLAGELDQTTPAALARELAARIPAARFQALEGCGHCPQIEAPGLFIHAVRQFLE
ncbi:MAG TPA: alpha/beta hydrolase [Burkholderiales bacterium]